MAIANSVVESVEIRFVADFDSGGGIAGRSVRLFRPKSLDSVDAFRVVLELRGKESLIAEIRDRLTTPAYQLAIVLPANVGAPMPFTEATWRNLARMSPLAIGTIVLEFCALVDLRI